MAISRLNIETVHASSQPRLDDGVYKWFSGGLAFDNTYMAIIRFSISPATAPYVGTVIVDIKNDDGSVAYSLDIENNFPLVITIPDAEEFKIGGAFRFTISGTATLQATLARTSFTCFNNSGDSIGIQS